MAQDIEQCQFCYFYDNGTCTNEDSDNYESSVNYDYSCSDGDFDDPSDDSDFNHDFDEDNQDFDD